MRSERGGARKSEKDVRENWIELGMEGGQGERFKRRDKMWEG